VRGLRQLGVEQLIKAEVLKAIMEVILI